MNQEFHPPIAERTTKDLLVIIGQEDDWQPLAVRLAKEELKRRGVEEALFDHAKYIERKRLKLQSLRKAKKRFTICDFLCSPLGTCFQLTFLWEYEKDGYLKKAQQQKKFRIILFIAIVFLVLYVRFYGC